MLFRLILLLLAGIYYAAYRVHHRVCLRPGRPPRHSRLIVVGSFLAGGAGKTPFTAWLAQEIHKKAPRVTNNATPRIAILCHLKAQDEARMLAEKLPFAHVVATANRYRELQGLDGAFDYIICDDGLEDTRLQGAQTIRLDWSPLPEGVRDLIPAGKCRSLPGDHTEPALILQCGKDVSFTIGQIANGEGTPFDPERHPNAVIACGIANSTRFARDLEAYGIQASRIEARPDHDRNFEQTITKILAQGNAVIITEKDRARLSEKTRKSALVFVAYQKTEVSASARATIGRLFGLDA